MSEERTRIEIGFDGGLIVIATMSVDQWKALEAGLQKGSGVVQFEAEDNTAYLVESSKVSYVKHELHVGRVGF